MDDKQNEKKPGNPWTRSLLIWLAVLFGLVLFVRAFDSSSATQGEPLAYSQFIQQVNERNVRSVTIATTTAGYVTITGKLADGKNFRTVAPANANVADQLVNKGVGVSVKAEEQSSVWWFLLMQSLPFLLILGISFFVMRQMQKNAGGGAMGFGKSRHRMLTEKQGRVTFADVAGIDEAREELQEIVEYL